MFAFNPLVITFLNNCLLSNGSKKMLFRKLSKTFTKINNFSG